MADLVTTPQFAVPFNISGSDVDTIEQDSAADRYQNAVAIIRYAMGERTVLPDFGIPDQALRENGANVNEIAAAVQRYEPNVTVEMIQRILSADGINELMLGVNTQDSTATGLGNG